MFNISQFLARISTKSNTDKVNVDLTADIISKNAKTFVTPEQVKISGANISIKNISQAQRVNIFLKKDLILNEIKERTGKTVKNIF